MGFEACPIGGELMPGPYIDQEPEAKEVIRHPKKDSTPAVLLKQHSVKLPSKYLVLP